MHRIPFLLWLLLLDLNNHALYLTVCADRKEALTATFSVSARGMGAIAPKENLHSWRNARWVNRASAGVVGSMSTHL